MAGAQNNGKDLAGVNGGGSFNGTGNNELEPEMDNLKLELTPGAQSSGKDLAGVNGCGISTGTAKTEDEPRKEGAKNEFDNPKEFFQGVVSKQKNIYATKEESLSSPWTFWRSRCLKGSNAIEYNKNLTKVYTCYTTANFWVMMNTLPGPSKYQVGSSLHIMRDLTKPLWEEPSNINGGSFKLRVQRKDLDKTWRAIVLATIGEQLTSFIDAEDEICGVSVSTQESEDLIMIWNKNAQAAPKATLTDCVHRLLPDLELLSFTYGAHVKHPAFGVKVRACCMNAIKFSVKTETEKSTD